MENFILTFFSQSTHPLVKMLTIEHNLFLLVTNDSLKNSFPNSESYHMLLHHLLGNKKLVTTHYDSEQENTAKEMLQRDQEKK